MDVIDLSKWIVEKVTTKSSLKSDSIILWRKYMYVY